MTAMWPVGVCMTDIWIPVSVGELCDKITILEIKQQFIHEPHKAQHIAHELTCLRKQAATIDHDQLADLMQQLRSVNLELWHIEEHKRRKIRDHELDPAFVELSTAVCGLNDTRARIKQQINTMTCSMIQDVKSHAL